MNKKIRRLFVKTWLLPFIAALSLLTILYTGYFFYSYLDDISNKNVPFPAQLKLLLLVALFFAIQMINAATFIASGVAGWRLARYWRQLPQKLFPAFLSIVLALSVIAFICTTVIGPKVCLYQASLFYNIINKTPGNPIPPAGFRLLTGIAKANSPLALHQLNDSLANATITARQHLISYVCKSRSRSEAIIAYSLNNMQEAGITIEEIERNSHEESTGTVNINDGDKIAGMVSRIRDMRQHIKLNTEQQWQYWLQPVHMLLLFILSFFMGALNRRRNIWALILLMIAFYFLFLLKLDALLAKANKKEPLDQWFIKLLPVFIEAVCCVVLYNMAKGTFHAPKPASPTSDRAVH